MLYIRADANNKIGSGHVMRCIAIAKALEKLGEKCVFVTADQEAAELIRSNGFELHCLDSVWNRLDEEEDKLEELIRREKIQKLLIDSYYITENYLRRLRQITETIYIDDLEEFSYPADIIINYSICADLSEYEKKYQEGTKLLIGTSYIPLREEFASRNRVRNDTVRNILITTGGSDSYHFSVELLYRIRSIEKYDHIRLHAVVGAYYDNLEQLMELKEQYPDIILHQNVNNMSELMLASDLTISAGGTTLYELCACGEPCICFTFADNQLEGVKALEERKLLLYSGDIRTDRKKCLARILESMDCLIQNRTIRDQLSDRMKVVVDGMGAGRIAEAVHNLEPHS